VALHLLSSPLRFTLQRHLPFVGYFAPIGGSANPDSGSHPLDRHLKLVRDSFELKYDIKQVSLRIVYSECI
jgi:hypothetical protein